MYFTGLLIYQAGGAIPWKPSGSEKANIGDENSLGDRKTYSYDLFPPSLRRSSVRWKISVRGQTTDFYLLIARFFASFSELVGLF